MLFRSNPSISQLFPLSVSQLLCLSAPLPPSQFLSFSTSLPACFPSSSSLSSSLSAPSSLTFSFPHMSSLFLPLLLLVSSAPTLPSRLYSRFRSPASPNNHLHAQHFLLHPGPTTIFPIPLYLFSGLEQPIMIHAYV